MKFTRVLLVLVCSILMSCEELYETNFDLGGEERIHIVGHIDQSDGPYIVTITQGQKLGERPRGLNNLCVKIHSEDGLSEELILGTDLKGEYFSPASVVKGEPGKSYWVEVEFPDGRLFFSEPETIPYGRAMNTVLTRQIKAAGTSETGGDFAFDAIDISVEFSWPDSVHSFFFFWFVEETYKYLPTDLGYPYDFFGLVPPPCYVTQLLNNSPENLLSSIEYGETSYSIPGFATREIDKSFLFKHIFSVHHFSTSARYHDYLRKVSQVSNSVGSLSDPPPGLINGNIVDDNGLVNRSVDGYFAAVHSDVTRVAVYPGDLQLSEAIIDDCLWDPRKPIEDYTSICLDCGALPRTTTIRPGYWFDTN